MKCSQSYVVYFLLFMPFHIFLAWRGRKLLWKLGHTTKKIITIVEFEFLQICERIFKTVGVIDCLHFPSNSVTLKSTPRKGCP